MLKGSGFVNAEIIAVGTELLLGHTINTDAAHVARAMSDIGVNLLFSCTVGDNPERLRTAVEQALSRSDILITTGGLGPTGDDLTKETVAAAAGKTLVLHEEILRKIEYFFQNRPFACGENQKKQAWLPEGCTVLNNEVGTAPGCAFETAAGKVVIMLPGPPSELIPMLYHEAVPYLLRREQAAIVSKNIHVFGMGEGQVAELIDDLMQGANPTAATYAKDGEMFVRVTARAKTSQEADAMCAPLVEEIRNRIGDCVYSVNIESLEELVVRELTERGMTIATAESCTGGFLAKRLTDVPGASTVIGTGVVTYANAAKEKLLGVPHAVLEAYGAVSSETARAMAEGVRRLAGSDLGVGITGIAGPDGGTKEKGVGLVYLALSDGKQTLVHRIPPAIRMRTRDWIRYTAASHALDMVRRHLEGIPQTEGNAAEGTGLFPVEAK